MRRIWLLTLILISINAYSTTYFVSAGGSDANNGTSTLTAWKTIAHVNTITFVAGDIISFRKGDSWNETLFPRAGAVGNPVTYTSYGSGAMPIITGFVTATGFTNIGGSVWESGILTAGLAYTNIVVINGVNTAMGHEPNTGYWNFQSHNATNPPTQITSSNLNSTVINWTGAELAVNLATYRIARNRITSHSGSTLTYIPDAGGSGFQTGAKNFIIQNDPRTLDQQNEWYYDPSTKRIEIFSASTPTGVQVPVLDSLVFIVGKNNITFDGISFQGANQEMIRIDHSLNISFLNCDFNFSGRDGIYGSKLGNATGLLVQNCTFNHINNNAIDVPTIDFDNATIRGNNIKNCGMIYGEIARNDGANGANTAQAISAAGANTLIELNTVDSMGFMGIRFYGNNSIVQNNYITNFCQLLNDGGAIYTWNGSRKEVKSGIIVRNNIIQNNSTLLGNGADYCIYFDDLSNGIEAYGNTCFSATWGFEIHNAFNINIHDNTCYNNAQASIIVITDSVGQSGATNPYVPGHPNNDLITYTGNIFFARTAAQKTTWYYRSKMPLSSMIPTNFIAGTNNYCRPIDANGLSINTNYQAASNPPQIATVRNLPMWVTYSGVDATSGTTPISISNVNQIDFEYNPTNATVIKTLPAGTWIDVRNVSYNTGTASLAAFTSLILLNTGSNVAPIANAGTDKNITLPQTSVSQTGSGTDSDGTIAGYAWTFISGPATGTASPTNTAVTTLGSMTVAGTYTFRLTVTDNFGLTGTDDMQVVVNAITPPNQPPVVDAGGNKVITLPTSTVTQVGSAVDPDGSIASYQWTQSGSNPIPATIVSPTSATTVINNLSVSGTYQFTLTATDNLGLTGSQTITVLVNVPNPVAPVANAGIDQTITYPTTTVSLAGSGTDADGVIVAYQWTKISGGAATITNANSASTTVTGLGVGVYQFQLKVTDNSGLTGTDVMQVTLNVGSASLAYTVLSKVFNNTPQGPTIVTTPPALATSTLFNGVGGAKINVGTWTVVSNITDPNWSATPITNTFTITPKPGTITVTNLLQPFTGSGISVSVSTSDPFATTTTYDGSASLPINAGNHTVITVTNDPNYLVTPDTSILVISQATPVLLGWVPTTPITYPTAIGGSQLNATWSVAGVSTYTPVSGTIPNAGTLTINLDFVPSSSNYKSVLGTTRTITVNQGATTITVSDTIQFFDGNVKNITAIADQSGTVSVAYTGAHTAVGDYPFTATYSSANYTAPPVSGTLHIISNSATIFITNYSNRIYTASPISPTVTSPYSYTLTFNGSATVPTNVNSYITIATINDGIHTGADTVTMTIIKANPVITWPSPVSPIVFNTALSATQYNHTASVPGTFVNSPVIGSLLPVGVSQVLSTTFTPTDAANYNTVTVTNTITVTSTSASMTFINTVFTYDGTAKAVQVVTNPANLTGVVITGSPQTNAGSYPISATLTNNNYQANPISGTLTINKSSNYTLSWAIPVAIQVGSSITAAINNPASTIAGVFTFLYPTGTVINSVGTIVLVATFHPTDTNYNTQTITVPLSVYGSPFLNYWLHHNGQDIYRNLRLP